MMRREGRVMTGLSPVEDHHGTMTRAYSMSVRPRNAKGMMDYFLVPMLASDGLCNQNDPGNRHCSWLFSSLTARAHTHSMMVCVLPTLEFSAPVASAVTPGVDRARM